MAGCVRIAAVLLGAAAATRAGELHVPADVPTIQLAIDAAAPGDTILVAPGTYSETLDFQGKWLRLIGEAGAEVTTIDGGRAGSVVSIVSGEPAGTLLRGFTVTNGSGAPHPSFPGSTVGGGVLVLNGSTISIEHCTIAGNVTSGPGSRGGGIYLEAASAVIRNCAIAANSCDDNGSGAMLIGFAATGPVSMDHCEISGNASALGLSAAYCSAGTKVTHCLVSGNTGHGMWASGASATAEYPTDCTFVGNSGWGLIAYGYVSTKIERCTFLGNGAGGALVSSWSDFIALGNAVERCVFAHDTLRSDVSVFPGPGGCTITNCSFDDAQLISGSYYFLRNCIVRGAGPLFSEPAFVSAEWSDIQGGWPGTGNIDAPPLWQSSPMQLYDLAPGSPCIDAGDPASEFDPDLTRADIGAVPHGLWADVGGGIPGAAGWPQLAGEGWLLAGNSVHLALSGAPATAPTAWILGTASLAADFKGGILWPAAQLIFPHVLTNATGSLNLDGAVPAGLPPGLQVWAQVLFKDPGAAFGVAASNGVRAAVP